MDKVVPYPLSLKCSENEINIYHKFFDYVNIEYDDNNAFVPMDLVRPYKKIAEDDLYYLAEGFPVLAASPDTVGSVDFDKIVGSTEGLERAAGVNSWFDRIIRGRNSRNNISYFLDNPDAFLNRMNNPENQDMIKLVEHNGQYYVADGNHRIAILN